MFKKPIIPLSLIALIAIGGIYMYSKKAPSGTKPEQEAVNQVAENEVRNDADAFNHILKMASGRVEQTVLDSVALIQKEVTSSDKVQQAEAYKKLGDVWSRSGNIICGGHYYTEKAKITNTAADWRFAAGLLFYAAGGAADSIAKSYAIDLAINGFNSALALDSTDVDSKVQLAVCLIDGKNRVMDGVTMLKQVEKIQPDHEYMNITLGRLAIVSGQFDKAIPRLKRLAELHPDNLEAHYYLAEAYRASGDKVSSIQALENAKKHFAKMPEAQKQIEELIQNIKKS